MRRSFFVLTSFLSGVIVATAAEPPPTPAIVAHRGLLLHAPENTLANFRACLELRLGFEFDVQRSRDGVLVCIHDESVDRTTNGTGKVSDFPLSELRELDAGLRFDRRFAGEKVPTIDEVLQTIAAAGERDVLIAVDLKAADVERDVVLLAQQHRVLHRLLFIGRTISEPGVRQRLRDASGQAQTAALAATAADLPAAIADPHSSWVYLRFVPTAAQIATVHQSKKRAFIAGVTVAGQQPENWRAASVAGIDAILTDFPLELGAALRAPSPR